MAQTKTRSSSGGGSSRSKNGSSSTKRASSSSSTGSRGGQSATKSTRARSKTSAKASTKNSSNRSGQSRKRTQSRSGSASSSRQKASSRAAQQNGKSTIGTIAAKAKGPALAGGAALVGLAGGMALNQRNKRKGVLGRISAPKPKLPSIDLPKIDAKNFKPDSALKAVAKAAGEVAQRSQRVGEVATEVQKASDALNGKS